MCARPDDLVKSSLPALLEDFIFNDVHWIADQEVWSPLLTKGFLFCPPMSNNRRRLSGDNTPRSFESENSAHCKWPAAISSNPLSREAETGWERKETLKGHWQVPCSPLLKITSRPCPSAVCIHRGQHPAEEVHGWRWPRLPPSTVDTGHTAPLPHLYSRGDHMQLSAWWSPPVMFPLNSTQDQQHSVHFNSLL